MLLKGQTTHWWPWGVGDCQNHCWGLPAHRGLWAGSYNWEMVLNSYTLLKVSWDVELFEPELYLGDSPEMANCSVVTLGRETLHSNYYGILGHRAPWVSTDILWRWSWITTHHCWGLLEHKTLLSWQTCTLKTVLITTYYSKSLETQCLLSC